MFEGNSTEGDVERYGVSFDSFPRFAAKEKGYKTNQIAIRSDLFAHDRIWGFDLCSGGRVLAPAFLVLPAYYQKIETNFAFDMTTTGMAAGSSSRGAIISAACEVIERDAYMISHLNRLPLPELDLSGTSDERIRSLVMEIGKSTNWQVRAWDMTLDIRVPSVLCASVFYVDGIPAVRLAAASHPSPEIAVGKAIIEVLQCMAGVSTEDVRASRMAPEPVDPSLIVSLDEHVALGDRPEYVSELSWLLRRSTTLRRIDEMCPSLDYEIPADTFDALISAIADRGLTPLAFELTPPEVQSLGGLHVWRVLVPGAQPLRVGSSVGLDSDRVRLAPVQSGYFDRPRKAADLNSQLHCFP